jgi:hypothetical protein
LLHLYHDIDRSTEKWSNCMSLTKAALSPTPIWIELEKYLKDYRVGKTKGQPHFKSKGQKAVVKKGKGRKKEKKKAKIKKFKMPVAFIEKCMFSNMKMADQLNTLRMMNAGHLTKDEVCVFQFN